MAKLKCEEHGKRVHVFGDLRKVVHRTDGTACRPAHLSTGGVRLTPLQVAMRGGRDPYATVSMVQGDWVLYSGPWQNKTNKHDNRFIVTAVNGSMITAKSLQTSRVLMNCPRGDFRLIVL